MDKSVWATLEKSRFTTVSCVLIGNLMMVYAVFARVPAERSSESWTHLQDSLFVSLSRPCFLIGLVLLMLPTLLGRANFYTNFFAATFWLPLSKLTYVAYLTFPIYNAILLSSMNELPYLGYLNIYGITYFGIIFTYCASFIFHILIEAPLMNLIFSKRIEALESETKEKRS